MAVINSAKKEINLKIVYYGPGRSGKTTSLHQLRNLVKSRKKSRIKTVEDSEKTLFFDFLSLSSNDLGGFRTRFQVYTVPGQVLYDEARRLLLQGVDGIVFVADSQIDKVQDNLQSLDELRSHLQDLGYSPKDIPMVIQYNKRDLPSCPPIDELKKTINIYHVPDHETVAIHGDGILAAFRDCARQVLLSLKEMKEV